MGRGLSVKTDLRNQLLTNKIKICTESDRTHLY